MSSNTGNTDQGTAEGPGLDLEQMNQWLAQFGTPDPWNTLHLTTFEPMPEADAQVEQTSDSSTTRGTAGSYAGDPVDTN
ncbi:hypothetical protein O9K51_08788 [Purpureocillium lavendulum]|uniref:Uncharacterized protein n=1 Tax=Purpureocillium lavendulum TaxID=1247861 RepID=A0AB34FIA0_9HYPO|nr:hypothetical protein O9K51_08788 [Purpureocillium lavendulum]